MSALRELLVSYGVDVNGAEKLQQLDHGINSALQKAKDFGQVLLGGLFFHGIKSFVEQNIRAGDQIADTAERLGVGTQELEAFGFALELSGGSAEDAATGLRFLNRNIGEALTGSAEAAKTFKELDVALKDDKGNVRELGDLLPEIADGFTKMKSQQEKTALAMKIFGRGGAALVPLLSKGSEGVQALYQDFKDLGGGLGKDFVEAADKAADQITRVEYAGRALKTQLIIGVIPTITEWLKKLATLTTRARELAKQTNVVKVAMAAASAFGAVVLINSLVKLAKSFGMVAEGAGLFQSLLGAGQLGLIALAIVAIFLVVEDLYTLFTGGESVIGDWIDGFAGIGESKKFVQAVKEQVELLGKTMESLKPIADLLKSLLPEGFNSLGKVLNFLLSGSMKIFVAQLQMIILLVEGIAVAISKTIGDAANVLGKVAKATGISAGIDFDAIEKTARGVQGAAGAGIKTGVANLEALAKPQANQNITEGDRNVTVNVYGYYGDDPKGMARGAAAGTAQALGDEKQQSLGALARRAP